MYRFLIGILALACACANVRAADVAVPANVAEHSLVEVSTKAEGSAIYFVLGPKGFVQFRRLETPNAIVFTGAPGTYQIMLVVVGANGAADQGQAVMTIGNAPPTPDNPDVPTPPNPPTPDDGSFNKLSDRVFASSKSLNATTRKALGKLHTDAATMLENGQLTSIGQAAAHLQSERTSLIRDDAAAWQPTIALISAEWQTMVNNSTLDKANVIKFYKTVASGLSR